MKNIPSVFCLLLTACAQASPPMVAIRAATVVDVTDGSLRPNWNVLVEDNRIAAVGPAGDVPIPNNAEIVDGAGGYLIPGLWDMHVHSVSAGSGAAGAADPTWHFPLFLTHGVTGIRNMNDGSGDPTLALTNSVKRRLASGDFEGPRLIANGPTVDGDPPGNSNNPVIVRDADEARTVVNSLADAGADFIKVYENLSRDAYFALMRQANQRGIAVDGHLPFRVTPEEAADAGQRTVEHVLARPRAAPPAWKPSARALRRPCRDHPGPSSWPCSSSDTSARSTIRAIRAHARRRSKRIGGPEWRPLPALWGITNS